MELALLLTLFVSFVLLVVQDVLFERQTPQSSPIPLNDSDDDYTPPLPPPVTIVICAHNEANNLQKNLPLILSQNHPNFEIIVVNDSSIDNTDIVLKQFQTKYNHLKVITFNVSEKHLPGKKQLIATALEKAEHNAIMVTDADCYPVSENWLNTFAVYLHGTSRIVLGYSPFVKSAGFSLINKLQRYETTQTAWQYFSQAQKGEAYMGVGRNMLFHKQDYLQWYTQTRHSLAGGDDDLFVNDFVQRNQQHRENLIATNIHPQSIVFTKGKETYAHWLRQKTRHASAAYEYNLKDKVRLMAVSLIPFIFYISGLLLTVLATNGMVIFLILYLTAGIIQIMQSYKAYKVLGQKDLVMWIPLLQPLYVFSISLIFLLTLIKKSDTWN